MSNQLPRKFSTYLFIILVPMSERASALAQKSGYTNGLRAHISKPLLLSVPETQTNCLEIGT